MRFLITCWLRAPERIWTARPDEVLLWEVGGGTFRFGLAGPLLFTEANADYIVELLSNLELKNRKSEKRKMGKISRGDHIHFYTDHQQS